MEKVKELEETIEARCVMVDMLEEEFRNDLAKLKEWSDNVDDYEEHIMQILR